MATPIALRIAGTKERKAGFVPLVSIGVLAGNEGDNMDRITLVAEKPAYIVKHAQDYILYSLIDRKVKSFDADAPGVLSIALTITRGQKLANNKSPYTLIHEVYEKFVSTYMTKKSDGRDEFIDTNVEDEIFRKIISEYPLEPNNCAYISMSEEGISGILCVESSKMEDFFKDTQYSEFSRFKDIEIGCSCKCSPELGAIQIPRITSYKVYINDKDTGKVLINASDSVNAEDSNTPTHEYIPTSFTLQEVLDAPNYVLSKDGANIVLDAVKERINCHLKKVEIQYKVNFKFKGAEYDVNTINNLIRDRKIVPEIEGFNQQTQTIPASFVNKPAYIRPTSINGYNISISTSPSHSERTLLVTISVNKESRIKLVEQLESPTKLSDTQNVKLKQQVDQLTLELETLKNTKEEEQEEKQRKKNIRLIILISGIVGGILLGMASTLLFQNFFSSKEGESKVEKVDSLINEFSYIHSEDSIKIQELRDSIAELQMELNGKEPIENAQPIVVKDPSAQEQDLLAESKRKEAEEKAQIELNAKNTVLQMMNNKTDIKKIRNSQSFNLLSKNDKIAVEAICNLEQYKVVKRKKVEEVLNAHRTFSSWQDVLDTQTEIIRALNNK